MHDDEDKQRAQRLEQVITTVFACRSVIKYNLSVDEKQQEKMLQDIDASLEVLRGGVLANTPPVQPHFTDSPFSQTDRATSVRAFDDILRSDRNTDEALQALYRMYHAFIDLNRQTNIQSFVTRFNEIISVLEEVRRLWEQRSPIARDLYSSSVMLDSSPVPMAVEGLLQKVKVFICDLYYIFMDFIRALSSALQQNDVHLNTDKLFSVPGGRRSEKIRRIQLERLQEHALQDVQEAYQRLRRRRLQVEPQVNEVTAFLDFLKEVLREPDAEVYQLSEILRQTDTISQLLAELLHIVADYEKMIKI
jgi:hypothetical protein